MESKMIDHETPSQEEMISSPRWLKIGLFVMFLLAALIRRDEIRAPGFAPAREYTSAIIARAFYYDGNNNIASWRQEIAEENKNQQPILEPPITEFLVSLIYRVLENEEVWYARYLTSAFWLIGGIFLYKSTKMLLSVEAALLATAYYLFVPMGIIVSRSFQPEALMMMMYLISLYYIIIYFDKPTNKNLLFVAILTGITLLIRPLVTFVLYGAYIAVSIHKERSLLRIFNRANIIFLGISFSVPFIYYGYGIFVVDIMRWKVPHSFRPHLFTHFEYWNNWFDNGVAVAGHVAIIAALLGFFYMRNSLVRSLVVGMSLGYFLFGLVFNFHNMTHSYYQVQLIPIVGICAAPFLVQLVTTIKRKVRHPWIPVILILLLGLYFSLKEVRDSLYRNIFEPQNVALEIGEIINHSERVVTVAYNYGLPLTFYGEFSGTWWLEKIESEPYRFPDDKELSIRDRLDVLSFTPEYFVITNFDRYNNYHQDLKAYLEGNCSIKAQSRQYLIYDNCSN